MLQVAWVIVSMTCSFFLLPSVHSRRMSETLCSLFFLLYFFFLFFLGFWDFSYFVFIDILIIDIIMLLLSFLLPSPSPLLLLLFLCLRFLSSSFPSLFSVFLPLFRCLGDCPIDFLLLSVSLSFSPLMWLPNCLPACSLSLRSLFLPEHLSFLIPSLWKYRKFQDNSTWAIGTMWYIKKQEGLFHK